MKKEVIYIIGLTYIREKYGMTMEQLGEKLGVSKQTVSLWESGKSKILDKRIDELSSVFEIWPKYLVTSEVDDLIKLEIEFRLLQNERNKYIESGDDEALEKTNEQNNELYYKLEAKRILKKSEELLKNSNNIDIYKMLNAFLGNKNEINKKLVHDTLFAMQKIFLNGIEDDDFSKALGKVLKTYNKHLIQVNEAMKEAFNGKDPFEENNQYPSMNHHKINFD